MRRRYEEPLLSQDDRASGLEPALAGNIPATEFLRQAQSVLRRSGSTAEQRRSLIPMLGRLSTHEDRLVRQTAARLLGHAGSTDLSVMELLAVFMEDRSANVRRSAGRAMARHPKAALPILIRLLEHPRKRVVETVLITLETLRAAAYPAISAVQRLLTEDGSSLVRNTAGTTYGSIGRWAPDATAPSIEKARWMAATFRRIGCPRLRSDWESVAARFSLFEVESGNGWVKFMEPDAPVDVYAHYRRGSSPERLECIRAVMSTQETLTDEPDRRYKRDRNRYETKFEKVVDALVVTLGRPELAGSQAGIAPVGVEHVRRTARWSFARAAFHLVVVHEGRGRSLSLEVIVTPPLNRRPRTGRTD